MVCDFTGGALGGTPSCWFSTALSLGTDITVKPEPQDMKMEVLPETLKWSISLKRVVSKPSGKKGKKRKAES